MELDLFKQGDYKAVFEASPDAMLVVDSEGMIRDINRRAAVLFGWRREEVEGSVVERLIPAASRDAHRRHRHHYGEGRQKARREDEEQPVAPPGDGKAAKAIGRAGADQHRAQGAEQANDQAVAQVVEKGAIPAGVHRGQLAVAIEIGAEVDPVGRDLSGPSGRELGMHGNAVVPRLKRGQQEPQKRQHGRAEVAPDQGDAQHLHRAPASSRRCTPLM